MPYSNGALLVLLVLGAVAWKITTSRRTVASAPLPPGPPADPIIGHIRVVPTDRPEVCYQKWGKEFKSDVLYLNLMGQPLIILNSAQAAIDLMDKRSSIYSDRPPLPMYEEAGWKDCIVFMSTGPQFRKHRKMFQTAFASSNTAQYRIKQESLARPLISRILQKPGDWREHLWRYAGSIVLAIAYGLQVTDDNDPWVILTKRMSHFFENGGSPGATLVDVIPLLRRLPSWVRIFPSLNYARDNYALTREFYEEPFAEVKKSIASGTPNVSFVRRMLEEMESTGPNGDASDITEDDIKGAASSMYGAGSASTQDTLVIFVLCMVLNPEVQERARQDLDRVVGRDRLPSLSDRSKLPYIDRIFYETERWNPTTPLGIPHKSNKDDIYRNMFIPNGSIVISNIYAMLHDPSVYSNPDEFNPDRYIPDSEGGLGEPLPVGNFGFGRRICPGQYLATDSVWIAMATLLATLKISKALDDEGKEITPTPKILTGVGSVTGLTFGCANSHPEEFPCVIEPRDEQAVRLIQNAE